MSKNGKLTLQDKAEQSAASIGSSIEQDYFYIPPQLLKEIESKNMVCRWINAKKLQENYGFDRRQWTPYKKEGAELTKNAFGGTDSEGYIRRGDLILAVRSKAVHERNSSQIASKNKNLNKITNKKAAEELRQSFREAGVSGVKVTEGYDDNE